MFTALTFLYAKDTGFFALVNPFNSTDFFNEGQLHAQLNGLLAFDKDQQAPEAGSHAPDASLQPSDLLSHLLGIWLPPIGDQLHTLNINSHRLEIQLHALDAHLQAPEIDLQAPEMKLQALDARFCVLDAQLQALDERLQALNNTTGLSVGLSLIYNAYGYEINKSIFN